MGYYLEMITVDSLIDVLSVFLLYQCAYFVVNMSICRLSHMQSIPTSTNVFYIKLASNYTCGFYHFSLNQIF
jgi:hypothetical protein